MIIRGLKNSVNFLFVYEMTQDHCSADSLNVDDAHYLNVDETEEKDRRIPVSAVDKTLLLQHWQRSQAQTRLNRPPLFLSPLALSPGADPFYMPCSPAITMTQFLLKTVSQIAERIQACTRAFKRSCPLEFNYAWCWVLLQKVLCQEFLIMLHFLSMGLQEHAVLSLEEN